MLQEQFAISIKRNRDAKNNVGADFGKLADIEDRLFRQKFVQKQNASLGSNSDLMKVNTEESDRSFATFQAKEEPKVQAAEESTVVTSDETSSQNNAQESGQQDTAVKSDAINSNQSQQESSADNNDASDIKTK